MARKPTLEFAGAIYHVVSRGNYRKELFEAASAGAFEKALFAASAKCGRLLHVYAELEEPAVEGDPKWPN